jgi:hypothetical protein
VVIRSATLFGAAAVFVSLGVAVLVLQAESASAVTAIMAAPISFVAVFMMLLGQ